MLFPLFLKFCYWKIKWICKHYLCTRRRKSPTYYMKPVQLIAINKCSLKSQRISVSHWQLCGRVLGILPQILTASDPWAGKEEECGRNWGGGWLWGLCFLSILSRSNCKVAWEIAPAACSTRRHTLEELRLCCISYTKVHISNRLPHMGFLLLYRNCIENSN